MEDKDDLILSGNNNMTTDDGDGYEHYQYRTSDTSDKDDYDGDTQYTFTNSFLSWVYIYY